ncbi:MAG: TetR/AcrR family transcriptional regulator [Methyloceanibacter sp.]
MAIGRPRAFDMDKALDRALGVFWRKGYEGATVADLTAAMGINPPSLYAAFGNKQGLFCKALGRYKAQRDAFWTEALNAPTARQVAEALLRGTAEFLCNPRNPRGCLAVQGALACGDEAEAARKELENFRISTQAAIRQRFKRALKEGDLPKGTDPAVLARYLATVIEGMSVQAASGASRKELKRVAETALRVWPA